MTLCGKITKEQSKKTDRTAVKNRMSTDTGTKKDNSPLVKDITVNKYDF